LLLARSRNLGPSTATSASVVVTLRPPSTTASLQGWATRHLLRLRSYAGGEVAEVSGRPASLGRALGVVIDDYRAPDGQRFFAASSQPVVPVGLGGEIDGLGRISSYFQVEHDYVPGGGLTPSGLLNAYDAAPLRKMGISGSAETIVAFETDGFSKNDLSSFEHQYLAPSDQGTNLTVVGGQAGPPEGESALDLETLMEVAPHAHLVYFNLLHDVGTNETVTAALLAGFSAVSRQYPGAIWSISLGFCEQSFTFSDLQALDLVIAKAESKGTTVFASSGDSGGLECTPQDWGPVPTQDDVGVQVPAALTSVTGVGGTSLSVTASGAYYGETAWSDSALSQGTGGGNSTLLAQPSWQVGAGLPAPSDTVPREVPDVAADADPDTGTSIVSGGQASTGGGTSLSAPIWAGFTALIDGYLHRAGKQPLGFANPALYRIAAGGSPYLAFHDVVVGGNDDFLAGPGYDRATGLGSPDVWNLARDLLRTGTGS